jgi:hypothetical protein
LTFLCGILKKTLAELLTIIYTVSLITSLIAGVTHELHHLLTHTLDLHHHHGESHHNHANTNTTHHHGDLIDTMLEDSRDDENEGDDPHVISEIKCFDHIALKSHCIRLKTPDYHISFWQFINETPSPYILKPDTPPPKSC